MIAEITILSPRFYPTFREVYGHYPFHSEWAEYLALYPGITLGIDRGILVGRAHQQSTKPEK